MTYSSRPPKKLPNRKNIRDKLTQLSSLYLMILSTSCLNKTTSTAEQVVEQQTESAKEMAELIDTALKQLDELIIESESNGQNSEELNLVQAPKISAQNQKQVRELLGRVNAMWNAIGRNPCSIWTPLERKLGKKAIQPYFFIGGSVEAGAGLHGIVGTDFVWDLYNLQLSIFNYKSVETVFGAGTIGAGLNTYLGLGFGEKKNVVDAWSGKFASVGVSGSLPVLSNYLSGHITHFTAQTPHGKPDYSIRGGSIGISAAFSLPTPAPGALQVAVGNWTVNKKENQKYSHLFKKLGINNSMTGQDTCQGACIRFDNISKGAGYTGRAVNLAKSLPLLMLSSSANAFPVSFDKVMLLALATGAYRDSRNRTEACRL
ncbi:MAG: hypothetical protein RJB13_1582 [Pseudomonadota bacterium]